MTTNYSSIGLQFREPLPANCPPSDAGPISTLILLRLVGPEQPTEEDFDSHAALGYECTLDGGECEWASCSMFLPSVAGHVLRGLRRFKRLKHKTHVALVEVDQNAGIASIKNSKHVDFWMYSHFRPTEMLRKVVSLDAYEPS